MHCESGDRSRSVVTHIAPYRARVYAAHGPVISDIIGLEKVLHFHFFEGFYEYLRFHEFYVDFAPMGEELFSGPFRPFIPFFIVFAIFYPYESCTSKVGSDCEPSPSCGDLGSPEGDPYDHTSLESMGYQELSGRFGVDPFELHELCVLPKNPFHPAEALPALKWYGMDAAMIPEVPVVGWGSCPVIGVVLRELRSLYFLHDFGRDKIFSR